MENTQVMDTVRWKLILLTSVVLLFVFALSTPFNFEWPKQVKFKEISATASASVDRMAQGNVRRQAGLLLLAAFSVFSLSRTENRYRINMPVGWLFLLYLGCILFSLSWSFDFTFTLRRVVTVYILWMSAIVFVGRYSLRELAFLTVLVTGATLAIGAGNELRLGTFVPTNEWWRFAGLFHAVGMAQNCGIMVLASMFLITGEKSSLCRSILWFIFVVAVIFLLLTKSRMAVASTLFASGLYWYRVFSGTKKALMVLGLAIAVSLSYQALSDRWIFYAGEVSTLGRGEAAKEQVRNLTGRLPLWKYCFERLEERPILGWGFNTFVSRGNLFDITRNVGWTPGSTHSSYLDALTGLGYLGGSVLMFFLLAALARAYNLSLRYPENIFVVSALFWMYYNMILETSLFVRPSFMCLFGMTMLARLALLPGREWERKI